MKSRTRYRLGWLACLALVACAARQPNPPAPPEKVTPQLRSGSNELHTYQVDNWVAPDDHTLIVNAVDRSLFEGRFRNQCTGLKRVNTIAFIVQTPPQVEKYQGVVLPDGTRCPFTSFVRLETSPPSKEGASTEHQ
jgi:Family of unknown function (DUF6491)